MLNKKNNKMNANRLVNKAEYISKNFHKPQFRGILRAAKADWLQKGNTFSVERVEHELLCDIHILNAQEVSNAVAVYILSHGEEMLQKEREAGRRYRARKKYAVAAEKVQNGFQPTIERGRIVWVPGTSRKVQQHIRNRCYPVAGVGKIEWEQAPISYSQPNV